MVLAVLDGTRRRRSRSSPGCAGCSRRRSCRLDELERRGLVARQRAESDRRRSVVSLTPEGEKILARADGLARSIEDSLFGDLPVDARERLNQTLRAGLTRSAAD